MRSPVADPPEVAGFDRHRRLRRSAALRSLAREHRIDPRSLVLPVFVDARITSPEPIASLPGHSRWPTRDAVAVAEGAAAAGVGGLLLFGLPDAKDEEGSGARDPLGPVPDALRRIRDAGTEIALIADVCLCEYTSHGHCGVLARARQRFDAPIAAYQVSGEYAAICAAAERGWIDRDRAAREAIVGIVRAGADIVITYFALEAAAWS